MTNNEPDFSHYLVCIYTHHENDELITPFLDKVSAGNYSSQFPVSTEEDFDICYELYSLTKEIQVNTFQLMNDFCKNNFTSSEYKILLNNVKASDWQNEWKRFFKPILIGQRLVIAPSWEEQSYPKERSVVLLDPGMAFGTGNHATTQGCLNFMEKIVSPRMKVLDFGTGSGILAISAVKLGADSVLAIDNDPLSITVAKDNSKINNCFKKITFSVGSVESIQDKFYDLIVANLTVAIHLEIFDQLRENCSFNYLLLSGISDFSKPELDDFLNKRNIYPSDTYHEGEWNTYLFVNKDLESTFNT